MQFHQGVDIVGNIGDPVRAAMDGTVMHRGANPEFGNFMVLQHGEYQTLYAHLSAFSVAQGQSVRQGQEIGKIGNTGRSTGPHLHFGVFQRGEPVNPVDRWR
jgi:murein DD-endopeptidase MepM/ murein hydrolase activator NlpD